MSLFPQESLLDLDFFLADWVSSLYSKPNLSLYATYEPGIEQLLLRTSETDLVRVLDYIIDGIQDFEGDNPSKVVVSYKMGENSVKICLNLDQSIQSNVNGIFLTSEMLNDWHDAISALLKPLRASIIITLPQAKSPSFTLILPKIEPAGNYIEELVLS